MLTGSNSGDSSSSSSSSSSSLSASSSETEEKDNSNEPPTVERKPEESVDEELSNSSSHSSSPAPSPEMPDIYTSEDEDMLKDAPKLTDPESSLHEDNSCHDLPVIERTVPADETLPPSETSSSTAEVATDTTDVSDKATTSTTASESSCLAATAELPGESSTRHFSEAAAAISESALIQKCVSPLPALVEESEGDLASAATDADAPVSLAPPRAETPKPNAEEETDKPVLPPTLVESSCSSAATSLAKTRRRKKQADKPSEMPGEVASPGRVCPDAIVDDVVCEEVKAETVSEGPPVDVEKKRKRKLSTCVEPTESIAAANVPQNPISEMEFEDVSEAESAAEPAEESKPKSSSLRRKDIPVLVKELTTPFEKTSKKQKLVKTGSAQTIDAPKDLECMQTSSAAETETDPPWKFDAKSDEIETDSKTAIQPELVKEEEMPVKDEEILESSGFEVAYACQPQSSDLDEGRISNEDANLLSEFAVECSKEALKNVFNDSPPASSENSPSAQDEATSPSQEEQTSTKSEQEANMEVEVYMGRRLDTCCDSQSGYDFSTASSDSTTSSSSSRRGFDNEGRPSSTSRKRKFDEEENNRTLHKKRRKDRHGDEDLDKSLSKPNYRSDCE